MNTKLNARELTLRLKLHSKENYVFIYSVMKALTVYSAAVALHSIISGLISGESVFLLRLPYWLASFAAMILTYNATMVGLLIIAYVPNWEDSVVPFLLAVVEYLLFSVLADPKPESVLWQHWLLIFSLFALICHIKIRNALHKTNLDNYVGSLRTIIEDYKANVKKEDIPSSAYCAIFAFAFWVLLKFPLFQSWGLSISPNWQCLLGIPALAVMIFAIRTSEKYRIRLVTYIKEDLGESKTKVPKTKEKVKVTTKIIPKLSKDKSLNLTS